MTSKKIIKTLFILFFTITPLFSVKASDLARDIDLFGRNYKPISTHGLSPQDAIEKFSRVQLSSIESSSLDDGYKDLNRLYKICPSLDKFIGIALQEQKSRYVRTQLLFNNLDEAKAFVKIYSLLIKSGIYALNAGDTSQAGKGTSTLQAVGFHQWK